MHVVVYQSDQPFLYVTHKNEKEIYNDTVAFYDGFNYELANNEFYNYKHVMPL